MNNSIPEGAVAACVLVLLYSILCLGLSILLVYMLVINGEKGNYITLIAAFISTSSLASIIQQIYFAAQWRGIQETELSRAKASLHTPSIAYTPLSTGFNLILYEIQYYCYCVVSMLIFFWATALAKGMYNLRFRSLTGREGLLSTASKIFAACLPALLLGISFAKPILDHPVAFIIVGNISLVGSLVLGSIAVLAIIYRYVSSRHRLASMQTSGSHTVSATDRRSTPSAAKVRVDKVLLLRFMVGFFILSAYEVVDILFAVTRKQNADTLAQQEQPNLSLHQAIEAILEFIPGVTGSLVLFLLFGTTAQFREQYAQAFRSLRFWGRRRPSLSTESDRALHVWDPLDSRVPTGTYRCTVKTGDTESWELQEPPEWGRKPAFSEKGVYEVGHPSREAVPPLPPQSHAMSGY